MDIMGALRKKKHEAAKQEETRRQEKRQLNVLVNPRMIEKTKRLSAEYSVARYAVIEHALEIGCFYLDRILKSRSKHELVREHLIDCHLLANGFDDPEEIMRIGEGFYSSELISFQTKVTKSVVAFNLAVSIAERTHNFDAADRARDRLIKSVLAFANWLYKHPLEDVEPEHNGEKNEPDRG